MLERAFVHETGEGTAIISIPYPTILSSHSSQFSSIIYFSFQISSLYLLSLPFLVFNVGKGTVYRQVLSDKEKVGKGNECERRMMRANPFLPSPLLFSFPPFKRVGRKCMGKRMRVTWLALSRPFSSICLFFLYLFFILKSFPPVVKANKRSLFIST